MANKTTLDETLRSPVDGTEQVRLATSGANWRAPLSAIVGMMYYVDGSAGNDSNSGALSAPWKTITKVNASTFKPGDAVLFQGGQTFSGAIVSPSAGTPAAPIIFGSYGGGQATISSGTSNGFTSTNQAGIIVRDLIFTGTGGTNVNGIDIFNGGSSNLQNAQVINCITTGYGQSGITIVDFDDVIVKDCTISGCANVANGIGTQGIIVYGGSNVLMSGLSVHDCTGATDTVPGGIGILVDQVINGFVSKCVVYNCGASANNSGIGGGPNGIVLTKSSYVTVSQCESHHNSSASGSPLIFDGGGIDIDGSCSNCTLVDCLTHDNLGEGYLLYAWPASGGAWANNRVINCVSINDGTGGASHNTPFSLVLGRDASSTSSTGTIISGCKFVQGNAGAGCVSIGPAGSASNFSATISGNFFEVTGAQPFVVCSDNPTSAQFSGNSYLSEGSFQVIWGGVSYSSLGAWNAAFAQQEAASVLNVGTLIASKATNFSHIIARGINAQIELDDQEAGGHDWAFFAALNGGIANLGFYDNTYDSGNGQTIIDIAAGHGLFFPRDNVLAWGPSTHYPTWGSTGPDAGISRGGAAIIDFGNGAFGDSSAQLNYGFANISSSAAGKGGFTCFNSTHPNGCLIYGTTDGNSIAGVAYAVASTGELWQTLFRDNKNYLIYHFDGVSTFNNAVELTPAGALTLAHYTTPGLLQNDASGNITTNSSGISATITTAKLTPATGANGSMTFVNGILTAQTQAT